MAASNSSVPDTSVDTLPGLMSKATYWILMYIILFLDTLTGFFAAGANIITIAVYRRLGYADSTNISLTALAISDLGVALTSIVNVLAVFLPTFPNVQLTTGMFYPYTSAPHVDFVRASALITTSISVERYLCVTFPLKIKSIITPRRTFVAMVVSFIASFAPSPIALLRDQVGWKFYPELNRSLLSLTPFIEPTLEQLYVGNLKYKSTVLPIFTISIVCIATTLLALSLKKNKAWRDANKSLPKDTMDNRENKEARAVKMVITIATVFIISSVPPSVHAYLDVLVPGFYITGRYMFLYGLTGMLNIMIDCINSSANVIIYYNMSTKFRQALKEMFSRNAS